MRFPHLIAISMVAMTQASNTLTHLTGIACDFVHDPTLIEVKLTLALTRDPRLMLVAMFPVREMEGLGLGDPQTFANLYATSDKFADADWNNLPEGGAVEVVKISNGEKVAVDPKNITPNVNGIWCVISSNIPEGGKVAVTNSYQAGNLGWLEERFYKMLWVVVTIGLIMTWYVWKTIHKFRVVLMVLEGVYLFALVPLVVSFLAEWGWLLVKRAFFPSSLVVAIAGDWIIDRLHLAVNITVAMVGYLFFCGYGTMYQRIPKPLSTSSKHYYMIMLVCGLFSRSTRGISFNPTFVLNTTHEELVSDSQALWLIITSASLAVLVICQFIIGVKTIAAFFKTKRQLKQFPQGDLDDGERVYLLFRKSGLIVFVVPIVTVVVLSIMVMVVMFAEAPTDPDMISFYLILERAVGSPWWMMITGMGVIISYGQLVAMALFWVRSNLGLMKLEGGDDIFVDSE